MNDWKLRLRQAREAKGLNKTEFARLVGVSNATVTDWEKSAEDGGIKELSGPSLAKISDSLGVDPHWIMSGKESAKPSSQAWPAVVQKVEPESANMLQWITAKEAELLSEFRACAEPQQARLLSSARGLPKKIARTTVREKA